MFGLHITDVVFIGKHLSVRVEGKAVLSVKSGTTSITHRRGGTLPYI